MLQGIILTCAAFVHSQKDEVNICITMLGRSMKKLQDANVNLRRLDKTKSEFLSIASHQLRTPISALKGYLSMILDLIIIYMIGYWIFQKKQIMKCINL